MRNLRRGVKNTYTKKSMKLVGELAILAIVERTRGRNKGVSRTGGKERRLKALAKSTIEGRTRLKNLGRLHKDTSPRRSNLTRSGKLLDSMKIKEVKNKYVRWGPKGRRRGEGITNEQVAEYVAQGGRPFNFLSKKDITKITKLIDKILQSEMRRL
jgi:hypothetical protein